MRVGLTGGIGSGKSTVAALLASKGAVIIDADEIARRVVERDSPVLGRLVEEFGSQILNEDGTLNRGALASVAFASERATRHLNEITHPAIREIAETELAHAQTSADVVIYEMPLLVETGQVSLVDLVVVVDVSEQNQVQRAMDRGLSEEDVRTRMARQASRTARLDAADYVIDNNGSREDTAAQVDRLWQEWHSQ